jgi:hypothetical protein
MPAPRMIHDPQSESRQGENSFSILLAENLEDIAVEPIDSFRREIDFVAYVLTDWPHASVHASS